MVWFYPGGNLKGPSITSLTSLFAANPYLHTIAIATFLCEQCYYWTIYWEFDNMFAFFLISTLLGGRCKAYTTLPDDKRISFCWVSEHFIIILSKNTTDMYMFSCKVLYGMVLPSTFYTGEKLNAPSKTLHTSLCAASPYLPSIATHFCQQWY